MRTALAALTVALTGCGDAVTASGAQERLDTVVWSIQDCRIKCQSRPYTQRVQLECISDCLIEPYYLGLVFHE